MKKKSKNFLIKNLLDSIDKNSKGTILRSMAIFTAIELCVCIITGKTKGNSKHNFITFCYSKYMPSQYSSVSDLLYTIFRCGVSHSYIPKGAALLSSNYYDIKKHLSFYRNGLFIYVPALSKVVDKAIKSLYQDIKNKPHLKSNYKQLLTQLDNEGFNKYQAFIQANNIQTKKSNIKRDIITDLI